MALKRIPDRDQNIICASINVNNFLRAIEELVYNSVDANSTSIAVRICIEKKYIQVLDNGTGITKDNFRLLGDKYVTNKFLDVVSLKSRLNKYGFKGISLASIIEISESVNISSRYQNSQETWTKIFCKGRAKEFRLTTLRPSKGTTVEISGLLYNLNIQQKSIDAFNEINSIKLFLEQMSLVHCNISLSLRDDSKNEIIFKVHKNRSIYQTLWTLFQIESCDLQDLQVEKNEYKIKAYIGKNNDFSKKYQWVYINGRNISKSFIHKKINECLTKKLCVRTNNKIKEKFTDEINFNCKIPFYFIFISCPHFDLDMNYINKQTIVDFKNFEEINKLIEKLVNFYCGDYNQQLLGINEVNSKNEYDTRVKVKEMMERILNKNVMKDITELQKGRKGRNIKRKDKKTSNNVQKPEKKLKENKWKSKVISNTTHKPHNKKTVCKIQNNRKLEIIYSSINKKRNKKLNKSKQTRKVTYRPSDYNEPILRKFKEETKSVKKRCQQISYEVQNVFNKTLFNDKIHEFNTKQLKDFDSNYSNDFNMNKKFHLRHAKIEKHNTLNKKINIANNRSTIKLKTSYDLLKTADKVEMPHMNICSKDKNTALEKIGQSWETKSGFFALLERLKLRKIETTIPDITYNSHERNLELNKSTIINTPKRKPYLYRNTLNQIYNDINQQNKDINSMKNAISNEYNNRYMSVINLELENSNNLMSQRNHPCETENVTNSFNYNMSYNINFVSANTYSIDILNSFHSNNEDINKTYSLRMSTNWSYSNYVTKILPSVTTTNRSITSRDDNNLKKGKSVFISESQSNEETIEPLIYCEAILNSNEMRDVEQEFDISFLENKNGDVDYLLNVDHCNNITCEIGQKSQYFCNEKGEPNAKGFSTNDLVHHVIQENKSHNKQSKNLSLQNNSSSLQILNNETNNKDYFKIQSRHSFVPKGMSQMFLNKLYKNTDSYYINEEYFEDIIYKEFANDVRNKFEIFEPDIQNVKDTFSKELNKFSDEFNKDNSNLTFNSESLKHAKIIGQIDRKFIAAIVPSMRSQSEGTTEFLTLFDQHAVDERVRLEKNLADYFDGVEWKSVELEEDMLKLNCENYFYLYNYKEKFSQFGLQWTFTDKDVNIHSVPMAIVGKNPRKMEVVLNAVRKLISEQIEEIKTARGNMSVYPKSIMELVFSEACRYAIKFGDYLSKDDCVTMIRALSSCKTPFQCAHGRPVMAVIMEISNTNRCYKIRKNIIKNFVKECLYKQDKVINKRLMP